MININEIKKEEKKNQRLIIKKACIKVLPPGVRKPPSQAVNILSIIIL